MSIQPFPRVLSTGTAILRWTTPHLDDAAELEEQTEDLLVLRLLALDPALGAEMLQRAIRAERLGRLADRAAVVFQEPRDPRPFAPWDDLYVEVPTAPHAPTAAPAARGRDDCGE